MKVRSGPTITGGEIRNTIQEKQRLVIQKLGIFLLIKSISNYQRLLSYDGESRRVIYPHLGCSKN